MESSSYELIQYLENVSGLHLFYIDNVNIPNLLQVNTDYPDVLASYNYNILKNINIAHILKGDNILHFVSSLGIEDTVIPITAESVIIISPYSTKFHSAHEISIILSEHGIQETEALRYFYYHQLPVVSNEKITSLVQLICKLFHTTSTKKIIHYVEPTPILSSYVSEQSFYDEKDTLLRYKSNRQFYNAICEGNFEKCMDFLESEDTSSINTHFSSDAIVNAYIHTFRRGTLVSESAIAGGLSPVEADKLYMQWMREVLSYNKSLDIQNTNIHYIKTYCRLVKDIHDTKHSAIVQKTLDYLSIHMDSPIDLKELCTYMGMSKYKLETAFQKECGISILKYHLQMRLDKATRLLSTTTLSIAEIAEQTGFSNQNYFSRIFRREIGCTPSEYREQ